MAGYSIGDDSVWDDDEFDTIPNNQLDELESNAIQFTQHQTQGNPGVEASSDYGDEFEDDDLEDAVVYDETQGIPQEVQAVQSRNLGSFTQREQFRQDRYGSSIHVNRIPSRSSVDSSTNAAVPKQLATVKPLAALPQGQTATGRSDLPGGHHVDQLQSKVQQLVQAQEALKRELSAKTGEIAIVRSKQEKAAKEFERELTAIRKTNAERLANQQKAIDAARDAEKTMATELEFVKRDLFEESERVKNLRKAKGIEKPTFNAPNTTPKKNKAAVHRDGFDDDEIQIISPSKISGRKSNNVTPTKAAKRKRKDQESPAGPLDVQRDEATAVAALPPNAVILDEALLERIRKPDDRLNFLGMILDHAPEYGATKTIEQFASISFPDLPRQSFASTIFEALPTMKQSASEFPIDFCELIISLWATCLQKKFYQPIHLLLDLVMFAVELKTMVVSPFIIDTLLPVAQATADLIGIPRFKRDTYTELEKHINVSACLELMLLAAQGCLRALDHTIRFWRLMRLDFVLMILSQHQPVQDFDTMLQMLALSVTRESIGPKAMDQDTQQKQVSYIIDRMSLLLVAVPTLGKGQEKHDAATITSLRLQILRAFSAFCQTPWGGEVVAVHRFAIGRLVKLMSDEVDVLYDQRSGYKQSAHLINLSARILHYLVTRHDRSIKMQEKLSVIHGGNQKYLLCLARLNFAEDDLLLDAVIEPEVAECAHEMLELIVTPEEGEAIHAAFSGG